MPCTKNLFTLLFALLGLVARAELKTDIEFARPASLPQACVHLR